MRLTTAVSVLILCCTLVASPGCAQPPPTQVCGSWIDAYNHHDVQAVLAWTDIQQLMRRIGESSLTEESFRKALERSLGGYQKTTPVAKIIRTTARGKQSVVLVRFDGRVPGVDYKELVCEPQPSGGYRVVDWYSLGDGELYSDEIALYYKLPAGDPNTLRAQFGTAPLDVDVTDRIRQFASLANSGESKVALEVIEQLPSEIAESQYVLFHAVVFAKQEQDNTAYQRFAKIVAEKYANEPWGAYLLIQYSFETKQPDILLRATQVLEQRVGSDAFTDMLRSQVLWLGGNSPDGANWYVQQAIRAEPDQRFAWDILARQYVQLRDYADAVAVYRTIQTRFQTRYERSFFAKSAEWADFMQSDAFNQWLPKDAPPGGVGAQLPVPSPASVANTLVQAIKDCNSNVLEELIDTGAMAKRAGKLTETTYQTAVSRAYKYRLVGALVSPICDSKRGPVTVKLMRFEDREGEMRALVRYFWAKSGSADYMEFVLEPDIIGRYRVVDCYTLSAGTTLSETLLETQRLVEEWQHSSQGSSAPDSGADFAQTMQKITQLQAESKYAEAIGVMSDLPTAVATSREFLLLRARIALRASNQGQYDWTLDRLAERYGSDPTLMYKMMVYYMKHQQYDKALERIAAIEQRVGSDGITSLMKERAQFQAGAYDQALSFAFQAVYLEPDLTSAWSAVAMDEVAVKNYAQAVSTFKKMQAHFGTGYTRAQFTADPELAGFVQSAEFQKWLPQ